jgi:hypothetical protein
LRAQDSAHPDDGQALDGGAAPAYIREAARKAAATAPPLVPGSARWNRLAAVIASIPVRPAAAYEPGAVTGDGNSTPPATCGDTA